MNYQHILFVTDLNQDSSIVVNKTKQLLKDNPDARLSVIHVVLDNIIAGGYEIMPLFNYADDKEHLEENAKQLKQFIQDNALHADEIEVVPALSTAAGIADYADEHHVDLITIGLHKKTGLLNSLLGNTATAVLNNANCDVLSVLIPAAKHD
ncbi:MAG: universal stress protein [Gammaproteobacteria bacterium]|nr:MAG: universal stress protein [Gammaproteobacteria bacterium]